MIKNTLALLRRPSRYLGNEINTIRKNWDEVELHIALAFPDLYEIGTSHFGIQILYSILNNYKDIVAERVFAPDDDMEQQIKLGFLRLESLESKKPLKQFDILGFSLLYELNYTNVLNILSLSNIPLLSEQRSEEYPILIAGGPCTFNPEPIANFFDAIIVGDGELVVVKMANIWQDWSKSKNKNKNKLLEKWIEIEGVYIPSFFKPSYNRGYQKLNPKKVNYTHVKKAILSDLSKVPLDSKPIVPFSNPVHDRLRVELSRGCTRGCRFCQAGMIYRPLRERSPLEVFEFVNKAVDKTGYEDISLLSLSTGDYCCILPLMEQLIEYGIKNHVSISLPSLRAETLTPRIINLVKKIRKTGFTIAPEAGSQRLRNIINKNILEEDITKTVESAFSLGWKVIKLYFMIGLPTECQDDLEAIVNLVKKLNVIRKTFSNSNKINVSVTTFIPKSHTPFQWLKQSSLEKSKTKIEWLRKNIKMHGIHFKWQDPHVSFIEGLMARGDRRLAPILVEAQKKGCRFDGWSDHFNFAIWEEVLFKYRNIVNEILSYNLRNTTKPLPWDHIKTGISKNFFLQELEKAIFEKTTKDCRKSKCQNCGICDFKYIRPILHTKTQITNTIKRKNTECYKKIYATFYKMGDAKYFGHLEMIKIICRSLKRAKISVKYSEGFHPSPKISFDDALPLGMESTIEVMTIFILRSLEVDKFKSKLNEQLPKGFKIINCYLNKKDIKNLNPSEQNYIIKFSAPINNLNKLNIFLKGENTTISIVNKKKKTIIYDLKKILKLIKIIDGKTLQLVINTKISPTLRPKPILDFIFNTDKKQLEFAKIVKI